MIVEIVFVSERKTKFETIFVLKLKDAIISTVICSITYSGTIPLRTVNTNGQLYTMELVYSGHLGTPKNCPDYRGVLILQVYLYTFILQWDHN